MLFIVLTVWGWFAYNNLRINNFPDVDLPVVSVTVTQAGAAPSELETQVTRIVEDSVAGLGSVKSVTSTVTDSVSVTAVEFQLGTDLEKATNDVRNAVSTVRANLPSDVLDPIVQRVDISGEALINFYVVAPNMNPAERSWFVDNDVSKKILAIRGVSSVQREGGVNREIRLQLNPERLAAYGVTAAQLSQQLKVTNTNMAGGRMQVGGNEQALRTLGGAGSVEQLANTRISLNDGRFVRLGDLGKVEDSWGELRSRARFNGEEVVGFGVFKTRGASEVETAKKIRAAIVDLEKTHPGVKIRELTASVNWVKKSFDASLETLIIGGILAVFVVWLFLRDLRATFVAAVAMPMSLIPTFALMETFNQSFNIVSLLALSLTIGILVDDAIVEIENIVRHIRDGKKPYPAAIEAADEIGLAVVATTATLVAVFAPVGFMPGVVGQFFQTFAFSACVSVIFSLIVARMLTPLMGAYILRRDHKEHGDPFWMAGYLRLLSWSLKHRIIVILAGVAFLVGSVFVAGMLPGEFIPPSDRARSTLNIELPAGAKIEETDGVMQEATRRLQKLPEVTSVYAVISSSTRQARVVINLVEKKERDISQKNWEIQTSKIFADIPGARFRFGEAGGGSGAYMIQLVSDNPIELTKWSQILETQMRGVSGVQNVSSSANLVRPEIFIRPKLDQAARLGVSPAQIAQAARIATLGDADQLLAKYNLPDRQIPIRVMLTEGSRIDLEVIRNLKIPTANGPVPLMSVADVEFGSGPTVIQRRDRARAVMIQGELAGITLGQANDKVHALPAYQEMQKNGVFEKLTGDAENNAEMGKGFGVAILTGILLMYVVLVLLFRSFAQPVTILTALPLSFGGAFLLLLLLGKTLSMPVFIGLIMLMGIAAKNSILLVEYAIEAIKGGMSRFDALMDAAHKRARPIIMTTVAMGAGMLPIGLEWGEDTEFRAPMALAVIGGLITSTLLSLIFVPVAFTIMDGISRRTGKLLGHALDAEGKEEAEGHVAGISVNERP